MAKSSKRKATAKLSLKATIPTSAVISSTLGFYNDDFARTLFPLNTNSYLINNGEDEIRSYISKCLDKAEESYSFSPQLRVYAAKQNRHLRRTIKLDVIAEYFIYDLIYRNRGLFRKPHFPERTHYGYRFENGTPIAPTAAYRAFKGAISEYSSKYNHWMSFDIASYFNTIYHHDLVSWFSELGASDLDADALGQALRQFKSGISIDCLPQGLYPTKMIGNDFIRFLDNHHGLRSSQMVRFMDDIYIFSNEISALEDDFQLIQKLLGEKGMSVNPQKTHINDKDHLHIDREIDEVKSRLLKRRRILIATGYDESGNEVIQEHLFKFPLSEVEINYIDSLLDKNHLEEEDAELILTIMRENTVRVEKRIPYIIEKFPHLTKNLHSFCSSIKNKEFLASIVAESLKSPKRLMEFQLFWFAKILEDYLMDTPYTSEIIDRLFNNNSATSISRAKILEIPDTRFGLPELRNDFLVSGQSDWLAWSAAVGSRKLKPISRNHRLKYFGNSSNMNHLIASIMMK